MPWLFSAASRLVPDLVPPPGRAVLGAISLSPPLHLDCPFKKTNITNPYADVVKQATVQEYDIAHFTIKELFALFVPCKCIFLHLNDQKLMCQHHQGNRARAHTHTHRRKGRQTRQLPLEMIKYF